MSPLSTLPPDIPRENNATTSFEFHFQEGFRGERVKLQCGDSVPIEILARTRFQTGLAHIETLELTDGQEVSIHITELDIETTFKVDAAKPFVTLTIVDGLLRVGNTATRPGYL